MLELFNLGNAEHAELLNNINRQVNEAIELAISKQMYAVTISIRVDVDLSSENSADGQVMLVPEYEHKIKTKLGCTMDGPKGKARGSLALCRDKNGYLRERFTDQQMTMEGVS